jgi:uncharacterized membrane protein
MLQTWKTEATLGELFRDLATESRQLVRQEVELAKAELKQSARNMSRGAAFVSAGSVLAHVAVLALTAAAIALLATFMALWLAALVVAVIVGAAASLIVGRGLTIIKQTEVAPQETIETVREDVVWLTKRR